LVLKHLLGGGGCLGIVKERLGMVVAPGGGDLPIKTRGGGRWWSKGWDAVHQKAKEETTKNAGEISLYGSAGTAVLTMFRFSGGARVHHVRARPPEGGVSTVPPSKSKNGWVSTPKGGRFFLLGWRGSATPEKVGQAPLLGYQRGSLPD